MSNNAKELWCRGRRSSGSAGTCLGRSNRRHAFGRRSRCLCSRPESERTEKQAQHGLSYIQKQWFNLGCGFMALKRGLDLDWQNTKNHESTITIFKKRDWIIEHCDSMIRNGDSKNSQKLLQSNGLTIKNDGLTKRGIELDIYSPVIKNQN